MDLQPAELPEHVSRQRRPVAPILCGHGPGHEVEDGVEARAQAVAGEVIRADSEVAPHGLQIHDEPVDPVVLDGVQVLVRTVSVEPAKRPHMPVWMNR